MQKDKSVILTRGVNNKDKVRLESIAAKNGCSLNFIMLQMIDNFLNSKTEFKKIIKK